MTHESISKRRSYHRPRNERGAARLALIIVLACLVVLALWFLPLKQYVIAVLEWTQGLGVWGPIVVALFYVVACVFFLPGSLITMGAGLLFGLAKALPAVWIGASVGACAAFLVGRTLARDWVAQKVAHNQRFAAIDRAIGREGFKIVLLLRLSPVFPFNLLNYALGLTNVSFGTYALATVIGMIPGAVMYTYLGSAARSLAAVAAGQVEGGLGAQIFFWVGLAATVLVAALVTRIARKSLHEAQANMDASPQAIPPDDSPPVVSRVDVRPNDKYNQELVSNVHPPQWVNPDPKERYNLVVIGAGTAGLVTAAGAAGLGAKVALIERFLMGGDCLNVGCVPSKAFIRSSRAAAEIRKAAAYGINVREGADVDFPAVMERMRRLRARISHHDSAERFTSLGVDVFLGHARFTGPASIEVAGKNLRFKKAVIATGARAVHPGIKGLAEAGFLTNETVFSLTERPGRLAIIGGGPIGCELAQAFQRLGSQVVLFHNNDHLLDREDADAAEIVQSRFLKEGIHLVLKADLTEVESSNNEKIICFKSDGREDSIAVDEILVGAGRAPNVENLGLETAGVQYDTRRGVFVDDHLKSTNPNIFAIGDISMSYKFTHMADAAARIVIQNALFKGSKALSALTVPWCTYTDPEIAHVGMYQQDAENKGVAVDTYVRPLTEVDRALVDGEDEGFVKIHVAKGTDRILGATVVAAHAGEMISEITLAMVGKLGLGAISRVIHPYPTQAEAIKHTADAYYRTRLTPFLKRLFSKWLKWNR
ncbi:MAG: FAD-containing oxidoreductase [Thermodesulfobacteriota bacterium]